MVKIFIGNLPSDTKEDEIKSVFKNYGKIEYTKVIIPKTKPAFAFVVLSN